MATVDLVLDLDDGLGPVTATVGKRAAGEEKSPAAPFHPTSSGLPYVAILRTPVAITESYRHVFCAACGSSSREFAGLFLEERLSNGVRVLSRRTLRELSPFARLPRKLDLAPNEVIDLCPECFMGEGSWRAAMAVVQAQAELPFTEADQEIAATTKRQVATTLDLTIELEPATDAELEELVTTQEGLE
jgi:hypothetical protein